MCGGGWGGRGEVEGKSVLQAVAFKAYRRA